jgi:hypothetical protein
MFAFLGLGMHEVIILLVIGLMLVAGPIVAVLVVLSLARRSEGTGKPDAVAELRAEVGRLREEVERLKKGSP